MYELIQVSELCYYIQSPAKIGVVKTAGNDVVLIDSGNDKTALSWLKEDGGLRAFFENNALLWAKV